MVNNRVNITVVAEIARALKELKDQMVFVGGAVLSLYVDDPAAEEIRFTADVDLTIHLVSFSEWIKMQKRLSELGFYPDSTGHVICSYLYKNIAVDIMPSEDSPIGPANKWFKKGFDDLWSAKAEEESIKILSAPCFLASKFEAFHNRGLDYRTSHDFEDIIFVLDNRSTIVPEIKSTKDEIRQFIKSELGKILSNPHQEEIISSHINPLLIIERYQVVLEKINQIMAL